MFIDGRLDRTLRGEGLVDEFIGILEDYVDAALPGSGASSRRTERPASEPPGLMARRLHGPIGHVR